MERGQQRVVAFEIRATGRDLTISASDGGILGRLGTGSGWLDYGFRGRLHSNAGLRGILHGRLRGRLRRRFDCELGRRLDCRFGGRFDQLRGRLDCGHGSGRRHDGRPHGLASDAGEDRIQV